MPDESESGSFAYEAPPGAQVLGHVVRVVRLRAGFFWDSPIWDDHGGLSDDYEDVERWLGISRDLFDDAMEWNQRAGEYLSGSPGHENDDESPAEGPERDRLLEERIILLHRLRTEVREGIRIDESDPGGLV